MIVFPFFSSFDFMHFNKTLFFVADNGEQKE